VLDAEDDAAEQQPALVVEGLLGNLLDTKAGGGGAGVIEEAVEPAEVLLMSLSRVTSVRQKTVCLPRRAAMALPLSSERPAMTTRAPSSTKRSAVPSPIPLVAPVMTAT
jgi:hypothetical protein